MSPHSDIGFGKYLGRYQLLSELGRGAMGVVYQARDPRIDRMVAIKTISIVDEDSSDEPDFRERFFQEARAAGRLAHPGIVTVFDVGEEEATRTPYIVMEYVPGCSLSELVKGDRRRLPLGPALQLVQSVTEALDYAHSQGVVHRDIKPANILISEHGQAKIADFGVAKLNQSHLTLPARIMGSPAYMSPEQLNGEKVDARSDLFSLSVVLYTILAGYRPFQGSSTATVCFKLVNSDPVPLSSIDLQSPVELDGILSRGMAKDPAQRFQSGAAMARAIAELRRQLELEDDASPALSQMVRDVPPRPAGTSVQAHASPNISSVRMVQPRPAPAQEEHVPLAPLPPATPQPPISQESVASFQLAGKQWLKPAGLMAGVVMLALSVYLLRRAHDRGLILGASGNPQAVTAGNPSPSSANTNSPSNAAADTASTARSDKMLQLMHEAEGQSQATPVASTPAAPTVVPAPPQAVRRKTVPRQAAQHSHAPANDKDEDGKLLIVHSIQAGSMGIEIEHPFALAQASVWLDGRLVMSKKLHAESKRKLLLFKQVKGQASEKISVLPGKHEVKVEVVSAADNYDQSGMLTQGFAPGALSTLEIKCDKKHNRLEIAVE